MKISKVYIQNFRSIEKQEFESDHLSLFIGDNGTAKTSVLEAINYCLSPYFLSGRIKHTDFYNGTDKPIIIKVEFDSDFHAHLPDGYTKQIVDCNGIFLEIKKRDHATPGKAFSDLVAVTHYVVPNRPKNNESGWELKRKSHSEAKPSIFKFDERLLGLAQIESENLPRSFYFGKNREKQLQKGFNSSASSIFDDFNWRFLKGVRAEREKVEKKEAKNQGALFSSAKEDFFTRKEKFEQEIIGKVDEASVGKCFYALNKKLKEFGIDEINMSFLHGGAPFETAFFAQKIENLDLPVPQLGSGIEMIIAILFLETLASLSKENIIVLIDEPELHLHPALQEKFVQYLMRFSETNQVFISTHSPYFFKNCLNRPNIGLLVTLKTKTGISIENTGTQFGLFPWSPSWGEINFMAYNLPTVEFHNELYGYLQEETKNFYITDIEKYFVSNGIKKTKQWVELKKGIVQPPEDVTLMTYVRNSIHHSENTNNTQFTPTELQQSIEELVKLVKNLP